MTDSLRLFPRDAEKDVSSASLLRPGSELAKARKAILEEGKPLHITELVKAVGKQPTKANRTSLSGSIGAYVRKGEVFTRPAPNTFFLKELEGASEEEALFVTDSQHEAEAES